MDDYKQLLGELYDELIGIANEVLQNCQSFEITILRKHNPTYEVLAGHMAQICSIMEVVNHGINQNGDLDKIEAANFHFQIAKAQDYAKHIELMAYAIVTENQVELDRLTEDLNGRSLL